MLLLRLPRRDWLALRKLTPGVAVLGLVLPCLAFCLPLHRLAQTPAYWEGLASLLLFALASIMAGSSSSDLAGLLNEMLSLQERLKLWGRTPWSPADRPELHAEEARVSTEAVASISVVGLQDRADLFPTFWREAVSAFHDGRTSG